MALPHGQSSGEFPQLDASAHASAIHESHAGGSCQSQPSPPLCSGPSRRWPRLVWRPRTLSRASPPITRPASSACAACSVWTLMGTTEDAVSPPPGVTAPRAPPRCSPSGKPHCPPGPARPLHLLCGPGPPSSPPAALPARARPLHAEAAPARFRHREADAPLPRGSPDGSAPGTRLPPLGPRGRSLRLSPLGPRRRVHVWLQLVPRPDTSGSESHTPNVHLTIPDRRPQTRHARRPTRSRPPAPGPPSGRSKRFPASPCPPHPLRTPSHPRPLPS